MKDKYDPTRPTPPGFRSAVASPPPPADYQNRGYDQVNNQINFLVLFFNKKNDNRRFQTKLNY